jgi:hydroxyacylglutathione hydrolase
MRLLETGAIDQQLYAVRILSVNFYLYDTGNGIVCFDTGFSKTIIRRELRKLNINVGDVTHVFLTHSDFDHTGGLSLFSKAKVYMLKDEEPLVNGKLWRAPGLINRLSSTVQPLWLEDGERISVGSSEIQAIHAPGHTPGSAAYQLNGSLLFTGDCFKIRNGISLPIPAILNMDNDAHRLSIQKLAAINNIDAAYTAHSGVTSRILTM